MDEATIDLVSQGWVVLIRRQLYGERNYHAYVYREYCASLTGKGDRSFEYGMSAGAADPLVAIATATEKVNAYRAKDPRWGITWTEREALGLDKKKGAA